MPALESVAQLGQICELQITVGTAAGRDLFLIGPQRITHAMEQTSHGIRGDGNVELGSWASSSAMVVVVRRDQRKPVIGSPAVSCSSRQGERRLCRAGFFRGYTAAAAAAGSAADDILVEQLLPTAARYARPSPENHPAKYPRHDLGGWTLARQTSGVVVHRAVEYAIIPASVGDR